MPGPAAVSCSVPDCDFVTPANCPTWEILRDMLQLHTASVHGVQGGQGQAGAQVRPKPAPVARPEVDLGATEHDWRFFKAEFERYKRTTGITGLTVLDELWHCQTKALRSLMQAEAPSETLDTEAKLLDKMKSLAVVTLHSAVHLVELRNLQQGQHEPIRKFVARARNIATSCDLSKKCAGCARDVSFLDETVFGVVLAGIRDTNIQQKILSLAAMKTINKLEDLITYVAAEESGYKDSANIVQSASTVGGVRSTYQQERDKRGRCMNCGGHKHGAGTPEDRAKHCPAFGKTCPKCGKKNHLEKVCKSKSKLAAVTDQQDLRPDPDDPNNASLVFCSVKATTGEPGAPLHPGNHPVPLDSPSTPISTISQLAAAMEKMPSTPGRKQAFKLPHSVHSLTEGWLSTRPEDSPTHEVVLSVDKSSYKELNIPLPRNSLQHRPARRISTLAVFDTGAQLNMTNLKTISHLRQSKSDLIPVATNVNSASNVKINILGGILLNVRATNPRTGVVINCKELFYVSDQVTETYLSKQCCKSLQTIPEDFPSVGSCPPSKKEERATVADIFATIARITASIPACTNTGMPSTASGSSPCECPRRALPPSPPALPCPPTEDNLPIIKQFILDTYAASAFNICSHQPLPMMKGSEPLRLHVDESAKPVAIKTPSQVPLHWKAAVKEGLERDVRLGVIEKVPENTPTTWCSRMLITAKSDGSPRRVVDFQEVNKACPRQTHHTETPWALVSSVPPNMRKSVLDAWHGYHSVEIDPRDRYLTTFLAEDGRYQYRTTPQGFIAAGDGYSQRMDKIIGNEFKNSKKCIDDTIIWNDNIQDNFDSVCRFLTKCSSHGVIFNPSKFQFGETTVKYLGFVITNTGIQPTPEFIQSIQDFPRPRNITDVRSWFGAVGQISFAFASAPDMLPFRHLLSTKTPFAWSPDLETAFQKSKDEIIRLCERGVRSFDPVKPTALATDWSKWASGFWLTQKHCQCIQEKTKPGCCQEGWQTVFCGSRFNNGPESRYAPIEGEAMAAQWAMDRCKYFLLGMPNFQLCVDHKPLLAIFSTTELVDIHNPRLFKAREKTLKYRFNPVHVPGKLHVVPDCLSRRYDTPHDVQDQRTTKPPTADISNILPQYQDTLGAPSWVAPPPGGATPPRIAALLGEQPQIQTPRHALHRDSVLGILSGDGTASLAGITADTWYNTALRSQPDELKVVTWERLSEAASASPTYKSLHSLISSGAPEDKALWPDDLAIYYHHRHALVPVGPVLLLHDRPLIPVDLRQEVLDHLHAGHAGTTGMHARASNTVYWPSMKSDITRHRAECKSCVVNAPSNPSSPPLPYEQPSYPFQSVCSDFFQVKGISYLAVCDRYSGWLSIFNLAKDDSKHVIAVLRIYFATWGIPVTLTTDGQSVYVSQEMKNFLARYGVNHRVSSAYYPQGNKRSEVAVKSAKRMIMQNLGHNGSLDTDKLARALLIHRNQTDPVSGLSPAQVIFGRQLRDHLPLQPEKFQPRAEWRMEADQREKTFRKRHAIRHEQLSAKSKTLPSLQIGDCVAIQDKSDSGKAGKWTKTGTVTDSLGFQSYEVKVDGSNLLQTRNRCHLRKVVPFINEQMLADKAPMPTIPPATRAEPATTTPPPAACPTPPDSSPTPNGSANLNLGHDPLPDKPPSMAPKPAVIVPRRPIKEKWIVRKDWKPPSVTQDTMSTVQALLITYPVSGSEGEGFART